MPSIAGSIGARPQPIKAKEGATQSYKAGDLVRIVAGYVKIGVTTQFNAIACKDATTVSTYPDVDVELISSEAIYEMTSADTLAQTNVGKGFVVTFTLGAHTIAGSASNSSVDGWIVGLKDAIGSVGGQVYVRFNPLYTQQAYYYAT